MTEVTVTVSESTVTVEDETGTTTVSVAEEAVSLVTVGTQGPEGPQGPQGIPGAAAGSYTHTQGSASDTWTINHNLGYRPAVELFSSGGAEMEGDIVHVSNNQCVVYFVIAVAGSARLQ